MLMSPEIPHCTQTQGKDLTQTQKRAQTHTHCHGVLSITRAVRTTSELISRTNFHGNKRGEQRRLEGCGLETWSWSKSGQWREEGRGDGYWRRKGREEGKMGISEDGAVGGK